MTENGSGSLDRAVKILGVAITIGGFLWGIWVYWDTSQTRLLQEERAAIRFEKNRKDEVKRRQLAVKKLANTRRIEATKPFLERQLKLYTEATQLAAKIATSNHGVPERAKAEKRFWELYWGELALVEDGRVAKAMIDFGNCLTSRCQPQKLKGLSLSLAHECRESLAVSWGVEKWRR